MATDETGELAKEVIDAKDSPKPAAKGGAVVWIGILAAVIAASSAGGYLMGGLLRRQGGTEKSKAGVEQAAPTGAGRHEHEYLPLEDFTVTLNTPRRERFLIATVVLAFDPADKKAVVETIDKRKPEVRSSLTLYLNGRTLEDVTGEKNLQRILREMRDQLNESLWPAQRPLISEVLFNKLAVQ